MGDGKLFDTFCGTLEYVILASGFCHVVSGFASTLCVWCASGKGGNCRAVSLRDVGSGICVLRGHMGVICAKSTPPIDAPPIDAGTVLRRCWKATREFNGWGSEFNLIKIA